MWTKLVSAFLGAPVEHVAEYFKEKQRLKQEYKLTKLRSKIAAERAKEERAKQADNNDAEWELLQIKNSGWKDEYVLIILSIPLVMVFVPTLAPYVLAGFDVLDKTPDWYQWLILVIFAAVYGIRIYRKKN